MKNYVDRSPFCDQTSYVDKKNELLKLSLEMAMSGMRDRFVDKPIEYIRESCKQLAELADTIIQSVDDSLLLQPASLDLATLKKRPGDHLVSYKCVIFILLLTQLLFFKFVYVFWDRITFWNCIMYKI